MSIFSDTLVFLRNRAGLSRDELSKRLKVSCTHIKRLETDYIKPDNDILNAIAEVFNVTIPYLLGSPSEEQGIDEPTFRNSFGKFVTVPVFDSSSTINRVVSDNDAIARVVLPVKDDNHGEFVGIQIDDNICFERMKAGDIAILEYTNSLKNGDIVAASYKEGTIFFCRYNRLGPTIILTNDKDYDPITYDVSDEDYKILGKVIAFHGTL